MSGWREYTTSELIRGELLSIGDGYRAKNSELVGAGLPFARAGNINNGFLFDGADCLPERYIEIAGEKVSETGDVVFTSKGTVGRFGFVRVGTPKFVYSPQLCFWRSRNHDELFPKFLYYWMHGKEFLGQVEGVKGQTDMADYVNLADQRKMTITLPSSKEQKSIASVLSSLDDKIDLLHRQNKTLEAMAETVFRQWFVEGAGDWQEGALGDVAINVKDAVTTSNIAADVKYIGLEHIERRHIALIQNGFGSDVSSNKYAFSKNDILFGKLRPYFHKVCFAPFQGICSTDILVIRPKRDGLFAYCLFAFFQNDVVEFANLGSGGTRMPRTDWGTLRTYPIMIPDSHAIEAFNEIANPAIEKVASNIRQIKSLENLRDSLLPKLMSGEIRVDYAQ